MSIKVLSHFKPLYENNHRYYVLYGGRGSGKSWAVAECLLILGASSKCRILCTRETRESLEDSLMALLKDTIQRLDLGFFYTIQKNKIIGANGTIFTVAGLYRNISSIKSKESYTHCWIEEAEAISSEAWETLNPTIRAKNSKIFITFNPNRIDDIIYKTFITNQMPSTYVKLLNYNDNPYFNEVLIAQMQHMKETDYDRYLHIWEGNIRSVSDAQVFKGKISVIKISDKIIDSVDVFYHGLDFGFSQDPNACLRAFIFDNMLYIDREAGGVHIEINHTYKLLDKVINNKRDVVRADSSRPETISYLNHQGYNIQGAKKGKGSVEDGVEYIKSFKKIFVDSSCKGVIHEINNYCYVVDKHSGDIQSKLEDNNNHYIDALRYALEPLMRYRGSKNIDFLF